LRSWRRGRRIGLASGTGNAEVLALEQARHGIADYQSPKRSPDVEDRNVGYGDQERDERTEREALAERHIERRLENAEHGEAGKRADLVIVAENPLANFKVLYGTGHYRLDEATQRPTRTRGIRWTIKDGIVYDAGELLADVRRIVADAKAAEAAAAPAATP